jgi:hypothetical protein
MSQTQSGYARRLGDSYPTPTWSSQVVIPYLPSRVIRAWDPAEGAGRHGAGPHPFKTNAVWVKDRTAQGYVFRNKHEHLLYGSAATCPARSISRRRCSTIRAAFTAPSRRRSGQRSRRCIPPSMRTRASNCRPRERNDSRLDPRRARSIHDAGTGRAMTAAELRCALPVLPAHTVTDNA